MRPAVVATVLLVVYTLVSVTDGICPISCEDYPTESCGEGWSRIDSHRCVKFFKDHQDYYGAKIFCRRQGGSLVSIHSLEEMIRVTCLSGRATNHKLRKFWIGAQVVGRNHKFGWDDGSEFKFTRWHRGEPNNDGRREKCAESNFIDWGYWNDASCDNWQYFMCAKKM